MLGRGNGILHEGMPVPRPSLPHPPNTRLNWPEFKILGPPDIPNCVEVFSKVLLFFCFREMKANLLLSSDVASPLHNDTQQLLLNILRK